MLMLVLCVLAMLGSVRIYAIFTFKTLYLLFQGTIAASELTGGALLSGSVKDGIPKEYWPGKPWRKKKLLPSPPHAFP